MIVPLASCFPLSLLPAASECDPDEIESEVEDFRAADEMAVRCKAGNYHPFFLFF